MLLIHIRCVVSKLTNTTNRGLLILFTTVFQVHEILSPGPAESGEWRQAFYYGPAFPTLARILIYSKFHSLFETSFL